MQQNQKRVKPIKPFHMVVFGGTGDLAFRKIFPALFYRFVDDTSQVPFRIFAITRTEKDRETFDHTCRNFLHQDAEMEISDNKVHDFLKNIELIRIPEHTLEHYQQLKDELEKNPSYQNIFYLSTPSDAFGPIVESLKLSGLINPKSKVVLEKPLGNSLASSIAINQKISKAFAENQIYRIDHYLGKETVQNLMVLRFANHLFEQAWNADHIDNVQITVAESIGVEQRGAYYDQSGALLDMVQNHLLQLLCLIAMEPPARLEADFLRNEKLKVLNSLRLINEGTVQNDVVKGQYTRGVVDGKQLNSYLEDIDKYASNTETFVAIKAHIDNWRWKGTPFYLRTGKRMSKRYSEIVINFKTVKHNVFPLQGNIPGNKLIMRLQPEERIELVQMTKLPGPGGYRYRPISLKLDYIDTFTERFPDAYERLIIDVLRGDQTLFMRQDELEAAWVWIESIVEAWEKTDQRNVLYEAGTWGPGQQIMEKNHTWTVMRKNEDPDF
jgi:glucose-6-phosphate 1-dehydrogenase